jgi:lysophospholipase L1-like esterase
MKQNQAGKTGHSRTGTGRRSAFLVVWGAVLAGVLAAEPGPGPGQSFLRPGDRWALSGDSITHNDIYRQMVARIQKHFHPAAAVEILQGGIPGATTAARQDVAAKQPTIVSIMLGMNNYINSSYSYGMDIRPFLDSYRKDMLAKVQACRAAGACVLLLSPTLTDDRFDHGVYELRGGRKFLAECSRVLREIAEANEGVYWIPVQEEFEAFEQTLGRGQILRLDGVHPSALGQYQIARTLWEHLDLAGEMAGERRQLSQPPPPVPVKVRLKSRFLAEADGLPLILKAETPQTVTATWSLGEQRGRETLELKAGETEWRPKVSAEALRFKPADMTSLVFDLACDGRRSLYVVDFACTPVLHLKDGAVEGTVKAETDRPEGPTVATWRIETYENGLLFSGEVFDTEIRSDEFWPWGYDGVNLYLDMRPPERFADISFDEDVHITCLTVHDKPRFGGTLIPWVGRGMHLAADSGAERTEKGYRWHLYVHRYFTKPLRVDLKAMELIGFNLVVPDRDTAGGGAGRTEFHRAYTATPFIDKHPNAFMVVDLKNRLPGDSVTHVHLFGQ